MNTTIQVRNSSVTSTPAELRVYFDMSIVESSAVLCLTDAVADLLEKWTRCLGDAASPVRDRYLVVDRAFAEIETALHRVFPRLHERMVRARHRMVCLQRLLSNMPDYGERYR